MVLLSAIARSGALGLLVFSFACWAADDQAEYAVRWLADASQVKTTAQVLYLLGKKP
jgi:hypothetical protein